MSWPGRFFCFDLRTGALIIGVLSLMVSCGGILAMLILGTMGLLVRVADNSLDLHQPLACGRECVAVIVFLALFLLALVVDLVATSLMVHGVRKNRPGLMYPYFFWGLVSSTLCVLFAVVRMAAFEAPFRGVATYFILAAIKICLVTVVRSCQEQVDRSRQVGLANSGWQQQPGGQTGLTYVRLV